MAGKIVPHYFLVPAGKIVPHAALAFAADGDPIEDYRRQLNDDLAAKGVETSVEPAFVAFPMSADTDTIQALHVLWATDRTDVLIAKGVPD